MVVSTFLGGVKMSITTDGAVDLSLHHTPENLSDRFALFFVKVLRFFADTFFAKRYGQAVVSSN